MERPGCPGSVLVHPILTPPPSPRCCSCQCDSGPVQVPRGSSAHKLHDVLIPSLDGQVNESPTMPAMLCICRCRYALAAGSGRTISWNLRARWVVT